MGVCHHAAAPQNGLKGLKVGVGQGAKPGVPRRHAGRRMPLLLLLCAPGVPAGACKRRGDFGWVAAVPVTAVPGGGSVAASKQRHQS